MIPEIDAVAAAAPGAGVLLDVRELVEWSAGHAPGAVHLPMSEIQDRLSEVDRSARIVCVCRTGNRSGRVTEWLRAQGYDALNMAGGMHAWVRAGQPVVNDTGDDGIII